MTNQIPKIPKYKTGIRHLKLKRLKMLKMGLLNNAQANILKAPRANSRVFDIALET